MLCVYVLIYYIRIVCGDVVILRVLVCLLQRLYSTFQMIATTLLLLLLLSQKSLVTGGKRRSPVSIQRRIEAKMTCIENYFKCFRKNRCHMEKFKNMKKRCESNYTDCMEFSTKMCDRIDAKDFIARKHLNLDGW